MTGYTKIIEDRNGATFREFVLRCARGIDFCLHMRDEPLNVEPREDVVSDYFQESLADAESERKRYRDMSIEEAAIEMQRLDEEITRNHEQFMAERHEKTLRYIEMRDAVNAWKIPSRFEGLRKFMLDQIQIGIDDNRHYALPKTPHESAEDWLLRMRIISDEEVIKAKDSLAKATARVNETNSWIRELYELLETGGSGESVVR